MTASPAPSRRPLLLAGLAVVLLFVGGRLVGGERAHAADVASRPPDSLVVDVRTAAEWAEGHLVGAVHVPLGDGFEAAMDGYARDRPVYVYCRSGRRSGEAQTILERMGFTRVVNAGGLAALAAAGAKVTK